MPYPQHYHAYHYKDVSQNTIHYKMSSYLTQMAYLEGTYRESLINRGGDCNGWSFLFAYYNSTNKAAQFKDTLNYLSTWNGKLSSLSHESLPESLKSKYQNGIEVFEQTINDLTWFSQIKTQHIAYYQISQDDRIKQFNLVTDNKHELKKVFDFLQNEQTNITLQELPDMLRIAHQWNNAWLDLGVYSKIGGHALSVFLNENGSYTYYDCNETQGEFTSFIPEEISAKIMSSIGYDTTLNDFSLYQLHEKPQAATPEHKILEARMHDPLDYSFKSASKFINMAIWSHDLDPIHTLLTGDSKHVAKLMDKFASKLVQTALDENHSELTKLILEKHYNTKSHSDEMASSKKNPLGSTLKMSDFLSWDVANMFYKLTQGTLGDNTPKTTKAASLTLEDCFSCDQIKAVNLDSNEETFIAPSINSLQPDNTVHLVAVPDIF